MNKFKNDSFNFIAIISSVLDVFIFLLSYYLSVYIRFYNIGEQTSINFLFNHYYIIIALFYIVIIILLYVFNDIYTMNKFDKVYKKIFRIIVLNLLGVFVITAILYFTRIVEFSRLTLILFYFISSTLICFKYIIMRMLSYVYYKKIYKKERVVVIGDGNLALKYKNSFDALKEKVDLLGYVSKNNKDYIGKCLGSYEDISEVIEEYKVDSIVIALESQETKFMPKIMEACEKNGTKIHIIPFYNDYIPKKICVERIGELSLFNLRAIPLDEFGNALIKRFLDIVGSLMIIILVSPIMIFTALMIKITMPGPIFFTQDRVGKNKVQFKMYKFRSMKINDTNGIAWSTDNDNRRTAFGKIIRKLSIDELPQLFNVLKGDMSLVGPRPEIPYYVYKFKETVPLYLVRQQVRPGMTGLAQINGLRGDTSIKDRVKYDIEYIENWSLSLDVYILLKTICGGFINGEKI